MTADLGEEDLDRIRARALEGKAPWCDEVIRVLDMLTDLRTRLEAAERELTDQAEGQALWVGELRRALDWNGPNDEALMMATVRQMRDLAERRGRALMKIARSYHHELHRAGLGSTNPVEKCPAPVCSEAMAALADPPAQEERHG